MIELASDVVEVARARISAILAHELKGLVQLQDLYLMKIDLKRGQSQSGELAPEIHAVRKLTDQMKGVISGIRALQSESQNLHTEENLSQLVQQQIDLFRIKFEKLNIMVNLESHLPASRLTVYRAQLLQVFTILLNNAIEAVIAPDFGGFRMVNVSLGSDHKSFSLSVFTPTNLDPKVRAQLQNGLVEGSTKELGWGLGLLVVQAVLGQVGGRLNVQEGSDGVTFETIWPTS